MRTYLRRFEAGSVVSYHTRFGTRNAWRVDPLARFGFLRDELVFIIHPDEPCLVVHSQTPVITDPHHIGTYLLVRNQVVVYIEYDGLTQDEIWTDGG